MTPDTRLRVLDSLAPAGRTVGVHRHHGRLMDVVSLHLLISTSIMLCVGGRLVKRYYVVDVHRIAAYLVVMRQTQHYLSHDQIMAIPGAVRAFSRKAAARIYMEMRYATEPRA